METNWNLDTLYKSETDKKFLADYQLLEEHVTKLNELAQNIHSYTAEEGIVKILVLMQDFVSCARKLNTYLALRQSCDTTNESITNWSNKLEGLFAKTSLAKAIIYKWICQTDLSKVENDLVKEHSFYLQEIKEEGKHQLDEKAEEVLAQMTLNASNNWSNLREYLTSVLEIEMDGKSYTLSSIRNLAYDSDPEIRKKAYEAEIKAYDKVKDAISFSLNSIKGEANIVAKLRGFDDVLAMTLFNSRMQKSTLDAMMAAIKEALPSFHKYLKQKAKILGHENGLPFYDLFAPLGSSDKKYTIEEAKNYLLKHFEGFSSEVSNVIKAAFDNNWIDFYPKKGKVGGAFCYNIPMIKESRILTNYGGSLSDIVTLAHELGHAYHGYCIQDHSILNTSYSMPVAETASTFNETVIMNAAILEAETDAEKIMLIESSLQDATQVICDILSRYIFEDSVIRNRADGFMFSNQLEQLMLEAQKTAYGDGLDNNYLHPYMWICKSHYYSAGLNYYNFPYAFGLLFAKGLYAKYQEKGEDFKEVYHRLLNQTTISSVEDVAKIANIDLSDKEFWRSSLKVITDTIDQFIELTNK